MYPINPNPPDPHVAKIAALNDRFRRTLDGGRVVLTRGVSTLGKEWVAAILNEVRDFETFAPENDPYDEHDFGSFEIDGHELFFKIDYYDAVRVPRRGRRRPLEKQPRPHHHARRGVLARLIH